MEVAEDIQETEDDNTVSYLVDKDIVIRDFIKAQQAWEQP